VTAKELTARLANVSPESPVRLGRYEIIGLVGQGGMGTVYDAFDLEHGTRVALKTLTRLDPANLLRFKNEFRSVADLAHPNLVPLYELTCQYDLWFFTMDYIDGVDFIEWLRGEAPVRPSSAPDTMVGSRRGVRNLRQRDRNRPNPDQPAAPPSLVWVRQALAQLVAGVYALHDTGYLHLDLKPSNVLIDDDGRVVILDFGLIRRVDDKRAIDDDDEISISGTPMWMAPEQFTDAQIGKPADWYAVGLMLYWALTGVPAFPEMADATETGAMRQRVQPVPPRQRVAALPDDLSELAVALLQPDAADRPGGRTLLELTAGKEALARRQDAAFIGRGAELEQLRRAYRRVAEGNGAVVHLTGSSGLGKTALLRRFLHDVQANGDGLALSGRCYERETVPYKAFDGLLDELAAWLGELDVRELDPLLPRWLTELVRVFPVLATVPAVQVAQKVMPPAELVSVVELRRRAVEALSALLANIAVRRPLVLEIDDLQWADADSVELLTRLLTPPLPGVLLIVSFRPDEARASSVVAPYLATATELGEALVDMSVGPLPTPDAELMAWRQLRALDIDAPALAMGIAAESGGVPFFIEELCHYVTQYRDTNSAGLVSAGISLDEVLAARVKSLPDLQRALIEVLSVANSPIPLFIAFEEAGLGGGALRSLWALRRRHLIRTTGAAADDRVELHHDRMRESVLGYLPAARATEIHVGLGRALAEEHDGADGDHWLFEAVRHLNHAHSQLEGAERRYTAALNLEAGRAARHSAAFPLAFSCFSAGTKLLSATAWEHDYDLALALYGGAAETAYLSAAWDELDRFIVAVKHHGRTGVDQLVGWEAQIDACIGRKRYADAVAAAIEALRLLEVELPATASEAEVGAAVRDAMQGLARVGPQGLMALPAADDARVVAAMRLLSRVTSAAYFAAPHLLPLVVSRQVTMSVERGLNPVTSYALSVFGIVLNTLGLHREAQTWGEVALELQDRFKDMSVDARVRHVVHNLVCIWTVPISSAVKELRKVVDMGKTTGDFEYAAYAAHGYIHNAMYAGWPLEPLYGEAIEMGDFMRGFQQVNALHVHEPFEQLLRAYLGMLDDPKCLDGDGFSEAAALAATRETGSSAGEALLQTVMGIARYSFGDPADAHRCFAAVRPMLSAMPSVWHVPMFHQYAALSIFALDDDARAAHAADAAADLEAMRKLAEQGPENFAHRVVLLEAESARAEGDKVAALAGFERAIEQADANGFINDVALGHELAARCASDPEMVRYHRIGARAAYERWGAVAKARTV